MSGGGEASGLAQAVTRTKKSEQDSERSSMWVSVMMSWDRLPADGAWGLPLWSKLRETLTSTGGPFRLCSR